MTDLDAVAAELTVMADRLEAVFNTLADERDATAPGDPRKSRLRRLALVAEKGMKALDREGVTW